VAQEKAPRITPAKARNAIKVAKIVAPVVLPLVTPYAMRAAKVLRDRYDHYKARKLGVDVSQLANYRGHGGSLEARISGVAAILTDLAGRPGADQAYVTATRTTLANLGPAVRAAERMPTTRRRAVHKSVAAELDEIETELLRRLGL
jgi:hypothetical protein